MVRISRQLVQRLGREPTDAEIAAEMEIEPSKVRISEGIAQLLVSLETPIGEEEGQPARRLHRGQGSAEPRGGRCRAPAPGADRGDAGRALSGRGKCFSTGSVEDGRSYTLEEVGKCFGVTRERIRQIEAKALRGSATPSKSKKLRDFLD